MRQNLLLQTIFRPFLRIVIRQPPAVPELLVAYKHIYQLPTNQASDHFLKKLDLTIRTEFKCYQNQAIVLSMSTVHYFVY